MRDEGATGRWRRAERGMQPTNTSTSAIKQAGAWRGVARRGAAWRSVAQTAKGCSRSSSRSDALSTQDLSRRLEESHDTVGGAAKINDRRACAEGCMRVHYMYKKS